MVGDAFDDFVFGCAVASSFHCQVGGAFTGFFLFLEGLGLGVLGYRRVSSKPDTPQSLINLFQKMSITDVYYVNVPGKTRVSGTPRQVSR